jgi:hypothetical protein
MRLGASIIVNVVAALAVLAGCKDDSKRVETTAASASASAAAVTPSAPSVPASPANGLPIPSASVAAAVNPNGLPAYEGPTGSVEGTITVVGPPAPDVPGLSFEKCAAALDVYGKLFRSGKPVSPGGPRPLADALVAIIGYAGYYLPERNEAKRVTIGENCAYEARAISMTFGQRLEIDNKTKLLFAPSLAQTNFIALMVPPPQQQGEAVKLYPQHPGYFTLIDQLQPYVREELYVMLHPLHAVSGIDGHYRIDGVPLGKLQVGARLNAIDAFVQAPVEVLAGVVQKVDITLTYTPKDGGASAPAVATDRARGLLH